MKPERPPEEQSKHATPDTTEAITSLSRRELLQIAGAAALNTSPLLQAAHGATHVAWLAINQNNAPYRVVPPVRVVRPLDLLVLDLDWRNLEYVPASGAGGPRLRRVNRGQPAYLILRFPPQHVAEEGRREAPSSISTVGHALSLHSRLVFRLPDRLDEIEYRLPTLLDAAARFAMNVSCRATVPPRCLGQPVAAPAAEETAIEVPYGLVLSPTDTEAWVHALGPVNDGNRVELWHTRLAPRGEGAPSLPFAAPNALRAIHFNMRGFSESVLPRGSQRAEIARLTSDTALPGDRPILTANRLMLSALGAWLDVRFQTTPPAGFQLSSWHHQTVMGRDQFVQVVEEGYLIPFGHPAALVTTRERRFADRGSGSLVAYLHEQQVIVVREPLRTYFADGGIASRIDRETPFRSVRLLTEGTPPIDNAGGSDPFLVRVEGADFRFQLSGVDRQGNVVEFSSPLVFVTRNRFAAGVQYFSGRADIPRLLQTGGQRLAFVPAGAQGDPAAEMESLSIRVEQDGPLSCRALWNAARVRIPAVKQLLGRNDPTDVILTDAYRNLGFTGQNGQAELYLQFLKSIPVSGEGVGGGLAQMSLFLNGISRATGAVCGPPSAGGAPAPVAQFAAGRFDPKEFFPDARILGSIRLSDLVRLTTFAPSDAGGKVPKFAVQTVLDANGVPVAVEAVFQWRTSEIQTLPFFFPGLGASRAELFIHSRIRRELTGSGGSTKVIEGRLSNFELRLVGPSPAITVRFRALHFRSQNGERPVIRPEIDSVQFGGALAFVDVLTRVLASAGDGLSLDLVRNGIRAGYTLSLPAISFGVFRMENISLSVGLYLPLVGEEPLSYSFAFGQRSNPFQVAVWIFTGGGYFEVEASPRGLLRLEAAIEFGASMGLDVIVASGKVEVMAGIRYVMRTAASPEGRSVTLEGYLRAGGSLEVLGIISVSVMLYLGLTYDLVRGDVWGRATVTVGVKVLFFSKSVSFSYEQRFAGSGPPPAAPLAGTRALRPPPPALPPFEQYIRRDQWQTYCAAFA